MVYLLRLLPLLPVLVLFPLRFGYLAKLAMITIRIVFGDHHRRHIHLWSAAIRPNVTHMLSLFVSIFIRWLMYGNNFPNSNVKRDVCWVLRPCSIQCLQRWTEKCAAHKKHTFLGLLSSSVCQASLVTRANMHHVHVRYKAQMWFLERNIICLALPGQKSMMLQRIIHYRREPENVGTISPLPWHARLPLHYYRRTHCLWLKTAKKLVGSR